MAAIIPYYSPALSQLSAILLIRQLPRTDYSLTLSSPLEISAVVPVCSVELLWQRNILVALRQGRAGIVVQLGIEAPLELKRLLERFLEDVMLLELEVDELG